MLDKRFIREHPDEVKAAVRVKGIDLDVDELLDLDPESRRLQTELDRRRPCGRARPRNTPGPTRPAGPT